MNEADTRAIEMQARWELEGIRRASERYREATAVADPLTLAPGRLLLREVCKPLIAAIEQAQEEAREIVGKGGRLSPWCWPMLLLEPATLAVITLHAAARNALGTGPEAAIVPQAASLAALVRMEVEYGRWTDDQVSTNRRARDTGDKEHFDLLRLLRSRYPDVTPKVWRAWRRKVQAAREEPWDAETTAAFGSKLFALLCAVAPDRFKIAERSLRGGHKQYYLSATEKLRLELRDATARAEVARPMLLPMVIQPLPWRYE